MMMSSLLKFILLSCGWFLFFAGHSFYRCVDVGFCVKKKRNLRFYRGILPAVVSKKIVNSLQKTGMPCLVRLQATISDPV